MHIPNAFDLQCIATEFMLDIPVTVFVVETSISIGILRVGSISGGSGSRIATQMVRLPPGTAASSLSFTKPMITAVKSIQPS